MIRVKPPMSLWLRIVDQVASERHLRPEEIRRHTRMRPYVYARRECWKRVIQERPNTSINAMAAMTGFDHATVLFGLKWLARKYQ